MAENEITLTDDGGLILQELMSELTDKQRAFVGCYLGEARFNASRSARLAGYAFPNQAAFEVLKNSKVKDVIAHCFETMAMDRQEVMARLSEQARASIGDFLVKDDKGNITLNYEALLTKGHLVKSAVETSQGLRIELYSAQDALQLIAKHLGMFTTTLDIQTHPALDEELNKLFEKTYGEDSPQAQYKKVLDKVYQASHRDESTTTEDEPLPEPEPTKQPAEQDSGDDGQAVSLNHYIRGRR